MPPGFQMRNLSRTHSAQMTGIWVKLEVEKEKNSYISKYLDNEINFSIPLQMFDATKMQPQKDFVLESKVNKLVLAV